ncbi:DUF2169 family type VI secretion system accessory protein [Nannocystis radixulma]|uniref:DUF2169 domain-containing protein n=1 Tax=Nannocystis radixulma TaxID=2995305 RepID=A0ABT5B3P2_9BACT|nr:DUF2169 domain-containing protein [Nannocystis radixulma]MDC0668093.1 DUF2169 domain-containing protein [Nannocystis radixulma]
MARSLADDGPKRLIESGLRVQITVNTTGMRADLCVATDPHARDHCVVVVKGTFFSDAHGELRLADQQLPPQDTDEHEGDPATTSIRRACDFVLEKPLTDVVILGEAMAPGERPVARLDVSLAVNGRVKTVAVFGERRWVRGLGGLAPSAPVPFVRSPLVYERAFGGIDDSRGPDVIEIEPHNPVGVGFNVHRSDRAILGSSLPNLEYPRQLLTNPRARPQPIGFGCVGRSWRPRIAYAGTYDRRWLDEVCPFLPADFDSRYHQCAPADQQFPLFHGGEVIRCVNMSESPAVEFKLPALKIPVRFRFVDRTVERLGALDTVVVEPALRRIQLVWRCRAALTKKLLELREIEVGERPPAPIGRKGRLPVFRGLSAAIRWLRAAREGGPR